MNGFQDVKKMMKLRKEAKKVQKKLKNIHIEAEENKVTVTINGEQNVQAVNLNIEIDETLKKELEESLVIAFNKGIKKSQEVAADNMKDVLAELGGGGFPGMDEAA
jgi:DNA-binding protein YbaB